MIVFNYETEYQLNDESLIREWVTRCIVGHDRVPGDISFVFCDDEYLHRLNLKYLSHNTYTDIISFDYSVGDTVSGDIFISVDRVLENSKIFSQSADNEMNRVIVHGVLHLCGLNDKTEEEKQLMRAAEERWLDELNR